MNLGKRIQLRLDELGQKPQWLANQVADLDVKSLCALIARDSKRSQFSAGIAKALGVTDEWLLTGEGNKLFVKPPKEIMLTDSPDHELIRKVDIRLSAGITGFAVEHLEDDGDPIVFRKNWLTRMNYKADKLVAVYVRGDSMEPGMHAGDTVVINTDDSVPQDGQVYAINYEGELLIKRMIRDAGEWWLSSDNPDQRKHPRKVCQGPFCIVIGRIIHKQSTHI